MVGDDNINATPSARTNSNVFLTEKDIAEILMDIDEHYKTYITYEGVKEIFVRYGMSNPFNIPAPQETTRGTTKASCKQDVTDSGKISSHFGNSFL